MTGWNFVLPAETWLTSTLLIQQKSWIALNKP